jgi:hypothetical protein
MNDYWLPWKFFLGHQDFPVIYSRWRLVLFVTPRCEQRMMLPFRLEGQFTFPISFWHLHRNLDDSSRLTCRDNTVLGSFATAQVCADDNAGLIIIPWAGKQTNILAPPPDLSPRPHFITKLGASTCAHDMHPLV